MKSSTYFYAIAQIRTLEKKAMDQLNIPAFTLMERAGAAAFQTLIHLFPHATKIHVVAGPGNNGGDGFVLAYLAKQAGLSISLSLLKDKNDYKGAAQKALLKCYEHSVTILPLAQITLNDHDVLVDAILGIGIQDPVKGAPLAAIQQLNAATPPIFSIDVPSGLDADTGLILGEAIAARATLTFIGMKTGLVTGPHFHHAGTVKCHDLNLPPRIFNTLSPAAQKLLFKDYKSFFAPRPRASHKGDFGHVLVIGGNAGMPGAAKMAGSAALRMGAGRVTLAVHPDAAKSVAVTQPELMVHAIETAISCLPLIEKADVIVLGPGLGQNDWAKGLFQLALNAQKPLVIDADGLNLLAATTPPSSDQNWILTPHPGEAARLLSLSNAAIQNNRLHAAKTLQAKWSGTVVLKGAGTLVASHNTPLKICTNGNPGMASAGFGDVLSGMIGALLGQGFSAVAGAEAGVLIHALAGDDAARTGERGLLATDLLPFFKHYINPVL